MSINIYAAKEEYKTALEIYKQSKHKNVIVNYLKTKFPNNTVEEIYCAIFDIIEKPRCKACGKELNFRGFTHGYSNYCSNLCWNNRFGIVSERHNYTNEEISKGSNYLQNAKINSKNTKITRLGRENNTQKHLKNYENLNIEFIREHFIRDGYFYAREFREYYGYKSKCCTAIKKKWNIVEPTYYTPSSSTLKSKPEKEFLDILDRINIKLKPQYRIYKENGQYYQADGFDHKNTIYEFLGDFYHGNPISFPNRNFINKHADGKTIQQLYDETIVRFNYILEKGYNIVYIWERDYNYAIKNNLDIRNFMQYYLGDDII